MKLYLVGQVNHTEVGLQLKAERGQRRGASVGPGELVEYDGIFRVQLFFLSVWERMRELLIKHSHLGSINFYLCTMLGKVKNKP